MIEMQNTIMAIVMFTVPGTYDYVVPMGTHHLFIQEIDAGGSGGKYGEMHGPDGEPSFTNIDGRGTSECQAGEKSHSGSGNGGKYCRRYIDVSPREHITITVGRPAGNGGGGFVSVEPFSNQGTPQ
jgi:hypothetical protein